MSGRKQVSKDSRQNKESALFLKQTFESVIQTDLFPNSEINLFVQVIQADGGERAAAVNATTLALANAGVPMTDFLVACTAGYIDVTPVLDLNFFEKSGSAQLCAVVLPNTMKVASMQLDSKLTVDFLDDVLRLCMDGCKIVSSILKDKVHKSLALYFS